MAVGDRISIADKETLDSIDEKTGLTTDEDGSKSQGSVMAKLNFLISEISSLDEIFADYKDVDITEKVISAPVSITTSSSCRVPCINTEPYYVKKTGFYKVNFEGVSAESTEVRFGAEIYSEDGFIDKAKMERVSGTSISNSLSSGYTELAAATSFNEDLVFHFTKGTYIKFVFSLYEGSSLKYTTLDITSLTISHSEV